MTSESPQYSEKPEGKDQSPLAFKLSQIAKCFDATEEQEVQLGGEKELFHLALDEVLKTYYERTREYEEMWLQAEQTLLMAPLSSLYVRSPNEIDRPYHGLDIPPHLLFFFEKIIQHEGVELQIFTHVRAFIKDPSRRQTLADPAYMLYDLERQLDALKEEKTDLVSKKPFQHDIGFGFKVDSQKEGHRRHVVPAQAQKKITEDLAIKLKRSYIESTNFLYMETIARSVGGEETEVIGSSTISRFDHNKDHIISRLPSWKRRGKPYTIHPVFEGIPATSNASSGEIYAYFLDTIPEYLPNRSGDYAALSELQPFFEEHDYSDNPITRYFGTDEYDQMFKSINSTVVSPK